jgi:vancomycin resistance protein YoaR
MLEALLLTAWGLYELLSGVPSPPFYQPEFGGYPQAFKETTFDPATPRGHNIRIAAMLLDGTKIGPNGTHEWSFNRVVGPRTPERGFVMAPTLTLGEVMDDFGGGVCQVSSTVFAAALVSGLTVVERHAHARPSSYIDKGFDATVNLPQECLAPVQDPRYCFDLKLSNPYDFDIQLRSDIVDGSLVIWVFGEGPLAEVSTSWRASVGADFQKRWVRRYYPGHKPKRKQTGSPGLDGVLTVLIRWPSGQEEKRVMHSAYKPVDEVWWVGTDWDKNRNPWE